MTGLIQRDQVSSPVVPFTRDQVDGTDPVLPGLLVNGTTGLIPSPVCSGERDDGASPVYLVIPGPGHVVHGPVSALVPADKEIMRRLNSPVAISSPAPSAGDMMRLAAKPAVTSPYPSDLLASSVTSAT